MANMGRKLTDRQREVLDFIISYVEDSGFPPSIREIGAALGISSLRGVTVHLDALERKGWIERESTSRSIRVLAPTTPGRKDAAMVPLIGTIAAGAPLLAVENVETYLAVPEEIVRKSSGLFALRVQGDSMTGDGILPGDLVIIRQQQSAESGELAAVLIGDEATVKRLRIDDEQVTLIPSNPAYPPIRVERDGAAIIGKVVGLVRSY